MKVVLYFIFFGIIDVLFYLMMHKKIKTNWKILVSIGLIFGVILLLHSTLFVFTFLLPLKFLVACIELSFVALLFNTWGNFSIKRTLRSTRLREDVKAISAKMAFILFCQAPYAMVFYGQFIVLFNYPQL